MTHPWFVPSVRLAFLKYRSRVVILNRECCVHSKFLNEPPGDKRLSFRNLTLRSNTRVLNSMPCTILKGITLLNPSSKPSIDLHHGIFLNFQDSNNNQSKNILIDGIMTQYS